MINFDLAVMTVLYCGRFLEQQRDADIPTQYWAIPEKRTGGLRTYVFEPPPLEFLGFLLYQWKFQTKQGFTPGNSTKLCYTP